MRKGEYRIRAQRFLTGEFNVEDLRSLFLFLRQNSYGNQTVRDLGDMVGHSDERNQGISLDRISDFSDVMRYMGPKIARHPNNSLDLGDAPAELIPAMDATYKLIDDDILLRDTGLRRDQTSTALTKLKRRFQEKSNGRLEWMGPINEKQLSVIKCLSSYILAEPAYDSNKLFDETMVLFLRHKLMDPSQKPLLIKKKSHLTLFAIVSMHGVVFKLRNGDTAEADAGWSHQEETHQLGVYATLPVPYRDATVNMSFPLFGTDLTPDDWVENNLIVSEEYRWNDPIELTPEPRIKRIS